VLIRDSRGELKRAPYQSDLARDNGEDKDDDDTL